MDRFCYLSRRSGDVDVRNSFVSDDGKLDYPCGSDATSSRATVCRGTLLHSVFRSDPVGSGLRFRFGREIHVRRDDVVSQIAGPQRQHDRPGSRQTGQHFHPILSTSQRRTSSVGISFNFYRLLLSNDVLLTFDVVTVASILLRCQFG